MASRQDKAAKLKAWRKKNPNKVRQQNRDNYWKHRQKRLEYQAKYRKENRKQLAQDQRDRRNSLTPEKKQAYNRQRREQRLKKKYGLSLQEYEAILKEQGGKCAICQTHRRGTWNVLDVDHCHDSGKVRGLLCTSCNTAIAILGDNEEGLRRALAYIMK